MAQSKSKKTGAKKTPKKTKKHVLVIVESPAKAKTIEHYLGSGYTVKASMGHLIDLPRSRMGVKIEDNFQPEYITVRGRAALLHELQKDAKNSDEVLLASDNDREGEAIAWHLSNALSPKTSAPIQRIVFNEITPIAIKEAVKHPGTIDEAKVNAQKARRVLDRLVGYNLSPILWKKVKNGLSAGRVQSVALRLICEREKEVESFIPEEFWTLNGDFSKSRSKLKTQLVLWNEKKPELKSENEVNAIIEAISKADFSVQTIKETDRSAKPKPPFTTSKMQQVSANRLGFTSKKTMQIAQELYEGITIDSTRVGLITYMRTDSVRISQTALDDVRSWLSEHHPDALPEKQIQYSVGKGAQDAHECIRPTYVKYTPEFVAKYVTNDQLKLYTLVWERFVASQMKDAKIETTTIDIVGGGAVFRVSASRLLEKGFYDVVKLLMSKKDVTESLPSLKVGDSVQAQSFYGEQHFTQGPARYSDASMVKTLEEKGIGRPSTYAPIISVLLDRYYVTRSNKQLVPTQLGKIISNILVDSFPDVINEHFTADVENKLDLIDQNKLVWNSMIGDFFAPFKKKVDEVLDTQESLKGTLDEVTDIKCEKCGRPFLKKLGRFGFFLACSGFPECRNTKSIPLAHCPKCGGDIVSRRTHSRGKEFFGCANYPDCDFITHFKPLDVNCPKCGWFLVEKYDKKNGSYKSCINPDCDYLHSGSEEETAAANAATLQSFAASQESKGDE